jgi:hypothetical protein
VADLRADLAAATVQATMLGEVCVVGRSGVHVEVRRDGRAVAVGVVDGFGDRLAGDLGVTRLVAGLGGVVLRGLSPGAHRLVLRLGEHERVEDVLVPRGDERPHDYEQRVLAQRLDPGYGYLETRDGTLLSCLVALPHAERWGPGPHPTVVQYSGYHPSRPGFVTGRPDLDTGMNTEANVCLHAGYAVVGLNMRGSGGSGGAFELLSAATGLDGHDAIEVVARQPWCRPHPSKGRAVGMVGRSMPGFTQVRVAATRPPSLAVITPAALGALPYDSMWPGGIANPWMQAHVGMWDIDPEPYDGSALAGAGVSPARYEFWDAWLGEHLDATGDLVGARNQLLRGHDVSHATLARGHPSAMRAELDRVDIHRWMPELEVPTLMMGTWQDQDSGSGFGGLPHEHGRPDLVHVLASNGTHEESRLPVFIAAWLEVLDVEVAGRVPAVGSEVRRYLAERYRHQFGEELVVPDPPLAGAASPEDAARAHASRPRARVLLEVGAAPAHPPGHPFPACEVAFEAWPPPAVPTTWYLHPGGHLRQVVPPIGEPATSYCYDPRTKPPGNAPAGIDVVDPAPPYDWRPLPAGFAAAFVTPPLDEDLLLVGPASLDLWIRCTAPDLDVEVALTEVRPDGIETYVQGGWLRASSRVLDAERTTALVPWLVLGGHDPTPLDSERPVLLRVAVGWHGHLFRRGSRLRVTVEAPGGNQPHWSFAPLWPEGRCEDGPVEVSVVHDAEHRSALVLPVVGAEPEGDAWPSLPPPHSLRRQPCRAYVPDGVEVDPEDPPPAPAPLVVEEQPEPEVVVAPPAVGGPPPARPGARGRLRAQLRPVKRAYRTVRRRLAASPPR